MSHKKIIYERPKGERPSIALLKNMNIISRQNRVVAESKPTWELIAQNVRLNKSMEHSPSSETNSSSANLEFHCIL
jgi:hypothetical protein